MEERGPSSAEFTDDGDIIPKRRPNRESEADAGEREARQERGPLPVMSWKNILRTTARKKRFEPSPIKHFYMLIYLLYFRYKVEFGITLMTYPEAIVTNMIVGFLVFSTINLGSRFLFSSLVWLWQFLRCIIWVYGHMSLLGAADGAGHPQQ